ncbi:MAG TPA: hypothetical protein VFE24_03760 [Pirellulales bacterium]|jgi:hypothetical protein|nr:hypothetical protein [Pirellulales bacterium]
MWIPFGLMEKSKLAAGSARYLVIQWLVLSLLMRRLVVIRVVVQSLD